MAKKLPSNFDKKSRKSTKDELLFFKRHEEFFLLYFFLPKYKLQFLNQSRNTF